MRIEKRIDENEKVELVVFKEPGETISTNFKGFRKDFLPLVGEHKIVKQTEHTYLFQLPEQYGQERVMIMFYSDVELLRVSGKCILFEYRIQLDCL